MFENVDRRKRWLLIISLIIVIAVCVAIAVAKAGKTSPIPSLPTCGTWGPTQWLNSFVSNQMVAMGPLAMYTDSTPYNYLSGLGPSLVPMVDLTFVPFSGFWGCQPAKVQNDGYWESYEYDKWGYLIAANSNVNGDPYDPRNHNPFSLTNYTVTYSSCSSSSSSSTIRYARYFTIPDITIENQLNDDCSLQSILAISPLYNHSLPVAQYSYQTSSSSSSSSSSPLPTLIEGWNSQESQHPVLSLNLVFDPITDLITSGNMVETRVNSEGSTTLLLFNLTFTATYSSSSSSSSQLLTSYTSTCTGSHCGGSSSFGISFIYDDLNRWTDIEVRNSHSSGEDWVSTPMDWHVTYDSSASTSAVQKVVFSEPHGGSETFIFSY